MHWRNALTMCVTIGCCGASVGCHRQSPPAPAPTVVRTKEDVIRVMDSMPRTWALRAALGDEAQYKRVASEIDRAVRLLQPVSTDLLRQALIGACNRADDARGVALGELSPSALKKFPLPDTQKGGESAAAYYVRVSNLCLESLDAEIWIDRFLFEPPVRFDLDKRNLFVHQLAFDSPNAIGSGIADCSYPVERDSSGKLMIVMGQLSMDNGARPLHRSPREFADYSTHFPRRARWW